MRPPPVRPALPPRPLSSALPALPPATCFLGYAARTLVRPALVSGAAFDIRVLGELGQESHLARVLLLGLLGSPADRDDPHAYVALVEHPLQFLLAQPGVVLDAHPVG